MSAIVQLSARNFINFLQSKATLANNVFYAEWNVLEHKIENIFVMVLL